MRNRARNQAQRGAHYSDMHNVLVQSQRMPQSTCGEGVPVRSGDFRYLRMYMVKVACTLSIAAPVDSTNGSTSRYFSWIT